MYILNAILEKNLILIICHTPYEVPKPIIGIGMYIHEFVDMKGLVIKCFMKV